MELLLRVGQLFSVYILFLFSPWSIGCCYVSTCISKDGWVELAFIRFKYYFRDVRGVDLGSVRLIYNPPPILQVSVK